MTNERVERLRSPRPGLGISLNPPEWYRSLPNSNGGLRLPLDTLGDGAEPDILADGGEGSLVGMVAGHQAFNHSPELGGVVGFAEVG